MISLLGQREEGEKRQTGNSVTPGAQKDRGLKNDLVVQ